ncbi:hypothetical protein MTBPR1_100007 [Candidatus Terasakiella magnetica]|uniref:Uncharacterized protein n=1 Tax=Candidatus Terasakiella magnetica TaxID=1867952 RepID=A0A1C3RDK6_9PROT|nr:hypothetical protein MTBPR1_100007 [Candidatus Terasakiella magnetica]
MNPLQPRLRLNDVSSERFAADYSFPNLDSSIAGALSVGVSLGLAL